MAKKKKYKPKVNPRDLNRVALIQRKKGAHEDVKREDDKNACRKPISNEE